LLLVGLASKATHVRASQFSQFSVNPPKIENNLKEVLILYRYEVSNRSKIGMKSPLIIILVPASLLNVKISVKQ